MRKFEFRLQRVMNIHNTQLDQLMSELSVIRQKIQQIQNRLSEIEIKAIELDQKISVELAGSMSSQRLLARQFEKTSLNTLRDEMIHLLNQQHLFEKECLERVIRKKREINGFVKLKEKQQSEHRLMSEKSDGRNLEDLLNK